MFRFAPHTSAPGPSRPSLLSARSFRPIHRPAHSLPFRPPPIRERLKPLIPFFIWWTILTSLTVHTMRLRIEIKEDEARIGAKVSVLQALVERTRRGEDVRVEEVRREFEMVGLRQRRGRGEEDGRVDAKDVGWREAIFGRRQRVGEGEGAGESEVEMKEQDLGAWAAEVMREDSPKSPISAPTEGARSGVARRASNTKVFL